MKKKKLVGKKEKTLNLNLSGFKFTTGSKSAFKNAEVKLLNAARLVAQETKQHFRKDKWPLDYQLLVTDVFEKAFGVHLENFLLSELSKSTSFVLESGENGLVISKLTSKKKKSRLKV